MAILLSGLPNPLRLFSRKWNYFHSCKRESKSQQFLCGRGLFLLAQAVNDCLKRKALERQAGNDNKSRNQPNMNQLHWNSIFWQRYTLINININSYYLKFYQFVLRALIFFTNLQISARFSWQVPSRGFITLCSPPGQELAFSAILPEILFVCLFNFIYLFILKFSFKYNVTFKMSFPCLEWNYSPSPVSPRHCEFKCLFLGSSCALELLFTTAISLCFYTPSKLPEEPLPDLLHSWLLPNACNLHRATLFSHLFS